MTDTSRHDAEDRRLDDLLDLLPPEPVPEGFAERLAERIAAEEGAARRRRRFRLLPALVSAAAAAVLFLGAGYWLGSGGALPTGEAVAPPLDGETASLDELYAYRDLLDSWELLEDPDLEPGLAVAASETTPWDQAWDWVAEDAAAVEAEGLDADAAGEAAPGAGVGGGRR